MKAKDLLKHPRLKAVKSVDEINKKIRKLKAGQKVVYTYGAWDLMHPGHINYILRAKDLGDFLIVGVVGDAPIRKLKGNTRPAQPADHRFVNVASLGFVDCAIYQGSYDPSHIIKKLARVDILTKADDWDYIPGTEAVEAKGGKLVKMSYSKGMGSTSKLFEKISGKKVKKAGEPKKKK